MSKEGGSSNETGVRDRKKKIRRRLDEENLVV